MNHFKHDIKRGIVFSLVALGKYYASPRFILFSFFKCFNSFNSKPPYIMVY